MASLSGATASCSSSSRSTDRSEKLLTKLSGFLISCAMPAVSWPSEAIFSDCTSRSWVRRRSASAVSAAVRRALCRVRSSWNSRAFSIASTALPGEGLQQRGNGRSKSADGAPADHQPADDLVLAQQRHGEQGMDARVHQLWRAVIVRRPAVRSATCNGARIAALLPSGFRPSGCAGRAMPPPAPRSCQRQTWARRPARPSSNS